MKNLQVKSVVATPEIAPAVPKQRVVERFGYVPGVLTRARGESPVTLLIIPSMAYLVCWYTEKPRTRDMVMRIRGAVVPVVSLNIAAIRISSSSPTSPETTDSFGLVSVFDAFPTILEVFTVIISI
jgi:hypothetical protein